MALPTLKPYFTTRGGGCTARLQRIVERDLFEKERRKAFSNHSQYFKASRVASQKAEEWTSQQALKTSLDKYNARTNNEQSGKKLVKRREALKELLEQENCEYEREIKEKVSSAEYKTSLRNRAEELRSAREERRKEVAQQKLVDHWKLNCPELREVQSRERGRETCDGWTHQIRDKRKEKEAELVEEERYVQEMERERREEEEREKELAMKKKNECKELSLQLRKQMEEVRAKEEESVLVEQEQALLMEEQDQLYQAEEERKVLCGQQQKIDFGRVLMKQARAKLRRRCKQVQESLELDLKILAEMADREKEEQLVMSERREKDKRDALYMKKVMEDQLALERHRESELDLMYQEEAAKVWEKREAEWAREKRAREELMAGVMVERQQQLADKMEQLKLHQGQLIEEREHLLRDIEMAGRQSTEEDNKRDEAVRERHRELKEQITERQRKGEEERLHQQWEEEQERLAEEEQDVLIREEIENVTGRHAHYQEPHPPDHMTYRPYSGRNSQYAWY